MARGPVLAATKPDILQRAWVGIVDQKACSTLYNFSLTDRMVCAGFLEGGVDSCQVRGDRCPESSAVTQKRDNPCRQERRQLKCSIYTKHAPSTPEQQV